MINPHITSKDLLKVPSGNITIDGLRHNIKVGLQYTESWLRGNGCVPLYNLMEDAATAEISRAQLWQWIQHGCKLENGKKINTNYFVQILKEELVAIKQEIGVKIYYEN